MPFSTPGDLPDPEIKPVSLELQADSSPSEPPGKPLCQCLHHAIRNQGFPDSSVGKESPCNAGDPSSIPGSGRSAGEGMGYPLQYSWASIVAHLVKNPPAIQETWVWKIPWEKGKSTHSSILAWRIPWGRKEPDMTECFSLSLFTSLVIAFLPSSKRLLIS